jgi:hypothetical protein
MAPKTAQFEAPAMHPLRRVTDALRSNAAILAMAVVAPISAHTMLSPDLAEAGCVTTTNAESTTTVCGPDVGSQPSTPNNPPHHQPNKPPKHTQPGNSDPNGEYQNPFRAVMQNHSLKPYRIDEGVDYRGHGRIYAIGDGVVTVATNNSSFFANEGGQNTVYRLTSGEAKGKSVFFGEACKPKPSLIGHKVTSKTVICHMHGDSFPGIETGWWNPHTDTPMAWPKYTPAGNPDGSKMAYGVNFSQLLVSLGAPGGNTVHDPARMSTNPGRKVGSLPRNWPRW